MTPRIPWIPAVLAAAATVSATGAPARAQVLEGVVVDSATQAPVTAVLVSLSDADDRRLQRFLVDSDGYFRFVVPRPGRYSLRAERLGLATRTMAGLDVGPEETVAVRIPVAHRAIAIEGIRATGDRRCELSSDLGAATHRAWEEARKVLNAASFTDSEGLYVYDLEKHMRELDPGSLRVRNETRAHKRTTTRQPFESRPVELLVDGGWVLEEPAGNRYFAPDADVLLSDDFLATHCLQLRAADASRPDLLGLEFRPVRDGSGGPDIEGVLWLSRETGGIEWLDFRYLDLPGLLDEHGSDEIGGRVDFRGLPDGSWIVSNWHIRMPLMVLERDGVFGMQRTRLIGIAEEGGRVVEAVGARTRRVAYTPSEGVVSGEIDRPEGRVAVVGTGVEAGVDTRGRFTIRGLPEGAYQLAYLRPALMGLDRDYALTDVRVTGGDTTAVRLRAPDPREVMATACGADLETWDPDSGVILGRVADADSRVAPGIPVVAQWTAGLDVPPRLRVRYRSEQTETGPAGEFQLCGVPADYRAVTVTAGSGMSRVSEDLILSEEKPVVAVSLELKQ